MARIMIVDDEESLQFTFKSFLSRKGHEVMTAWNYVSALAILEKLRPDLIFVDILLPGGKTGLDLLGEIRERGMRSPVIVITGQPGVETAAEAVRQGAFDYVPKPIRKETLLRLTETALKFNALELEKKAMEAEKDRYRRHLEAVFRSVEDTIITVDKELRVISVNTALKSLCGISPGETMGKTLQEAKCHCLARCLETISGSLKERRPVRDLHIECRRSDRLNQAVVVNSTPLKGDDDAFAGMVLVIRDITRINRLEKKLSQRYSFHNIIGKNPAMQRIYTLLEDLADIDSTILITGESGTGKELLVNALHYSSSRSRGPLVRVNCSALSESLLESELFGHVRGAFTGAIKDRKGRFELASGGTLFLDEIGDIPQRIQVKLLRALQEKEIEKVGDSAPVPVDVRLVAATHQDLAERIRQGVFREDLYYRLKVLKIALPPLRERRDDIPLLMDHFRVLFNRELKRNVERISNEVVDLFMGYPWPGNIRELKHALEHAFILCRDRLLAPGHLPDEIKNSAAISAGGRCAKGGTTAGASPEADERQRILDALSRTGGNKAGAARLLGFTRQTLYRKISRLHIGVAGGPNDQV